MPSRRSCERVERGPMPKRARELADASIHPSTSVHQGHRRARWTKLSSSSLSIIERRDSRRGPTTRGIAVGLVHGPNPASAAAPAREPRPSVRRPRIEAAAEHVVRQALLLGRRRHGWPKALRRAGDRRRSQVRRHCHDDADVGPAPARRARGPSRERSAVGDAEPRHVPRCGAAVLLRGGEGEGDGRRVEGQGARVER